MGACCCGPPNDDIPPGDDGAKTQLVDFLTTACTQSDDQLRLRARHICGDKIKEHQLNKLVDMIDSMTARFQRLEALQGDTAFDACTCVVTTGTGQVSIDGQSIEAALDELTVVSLQDAQRDYAMNIITNQSNPGLRDLSLERRERLFAGHAAVHGDMNSLGRIVADLRPSHSLATL